LSFAVSVISVVAAVGSCIAASWVSIFATRQIRAGERQAEAARQQADFARQQAVEARDGNRKAERAAQIQLVIHFADTYHKVRALGLNSSDQWGEEFWGLHLLEFFYFDQGDVPQFIYGLWMVELASLYSKDPTLWKSHEAYLSRFSRTYERMYRFFQGISEVALRDKNVPSARDNTVQQLVYSWERKR
jgi:hypothetical protein